METLSVKKCIRVKLPEAFELPRKFGVSWGCLTQGAFRGIDAVIAEGGRKGIHFRYVLPYDTIAKRYMAEYGQRERREGYGISPTLADALYELAAKYEVEVVIEKTRYKTYYYAVVDGVRIEGSLCYRENLRGCISEVLRRVREQREWEESLRRQRIRKEVLNTVAEWYFRCFGETPADPLKVAKRLEEYHALCQMRSAAKREFGVAPTERALRGAFWWDGEWGGRALSCFVTEREAVCNWGNTKWKFLVMTTTDGVYIKPESPLYQEWIKVAHSDGDS
ncbi:PaRep2a protein [Pyrobaculum aerophilum]|uniref:PaRep2a protein n=1 Tax=Pyrobaculum aerophilum TaxID=13773 RepID=UPI002FDA82BF